MWLLYYCCSAKKSLIWVANLLSPAVTRKIRIQWNKVPHTAHYLVKSAISNFKENMLEFVQKDTLFCSYMRKPQEISNHVKSTDCWSIINIKNWDVMCDIKKAGNFRQSEARDTFYFPAVKKIWYGEKFLLGWIYYRLLQCVFDRTILICFQINSPPAKDFRALW